jgi:hypothetical protein
MIRIMDNIAKHKHHLLLGEYFLNDIVIHSVACVIMARLIC